MMYQIQYSNKFKRSYKLAQKRGLKVDKLLDVVHQLAEGKALDVKYRDHELLGKFKGYRECHIQPDWLLIYKQYKDVCVLYLMDTGTHADLLDM